MLCPKHAAMTQIKSTPAAANQYMVETARTYVARLWSDHRDKRWLFHNYAQAAGVVKCLQNIAAHEPLPEEVVEIATLSAWFFNTGYLYDPQQVAEKSAISAEFFLAEHRYAPEKIHRVHQCIITALNQMHPKTLEAQLLNDAIVAHNLVEQWPDNLTAQKAEMEGLLGRKMSQTEWQRVVLQQIHEAVLYLPYSKEAYEPRLGVHFIEAKQALENLETKTETKTESVPSGAFQNLTGKRLRAAIQTYYRSNYNNHIHLSAIADNKAHIMISVNSILISVAISILTYHTLTDRNPLLVLPIVIFLVTALTSLIFAVLSSRPRIQGKPNRTPGRTNWMFFGNFVHLSMEEYEKEVDDMLRDGASLYGSMTRDTYMLGKVLDKKYRLLTISYNVFMLGFVATVVSYLTAYFLG